MENIADIQHREEPFELYGRPYLFESEYTDEELASQELERTRQTEGQQADELPAPSVS